MSDRLDCYQIEWVTQDEPLQSRLIEALYEEIEYEAQDGYLTPGITCVQADGEWTPDFDEKTRALLQEVGVAYRVDYGYEVRAWAPGLADEIVVEQVISVHGRRASEPKSGAAQALVDFSLR